MHTQFEGALLVVAWEYVHGVLLGTASLIAFQGLAKMHVMYAGVKAVVV